MKLTQNTILITGGNSGIGLALALELQKRGNTIIISGRSREKLKAAEARGLKTIEADLSKPDDVKKLAQQVIKDFPDLNGIIHSAGIMKNENIQDGNNLLIMQETFATNVLATMILTESLVSNLTQKTNSFIMTVSSGLAYAPLAMTPSYSASKAAIHSYTQSLRFQLRETAVRVIELVPPYVQTSLMGSRQAQDPMAMPLNDFISEVMTIMEKGDDNMKEILVGRVLPQRNSADGGREKHEDFTMQMNQRLWDIRKEEFPSSGMQS